MTSKLIIDEFLASKKLAVVGVSRSGNKFGNTVFRELKAKGYTVYPVNPNANEVEGEKCFPDIKSLPDKVDGAVVVVPLNESEKVVRSAALAGIKNIWLQQGSGSNEAINFCRDNGNVRQQKSQCSGSKTAR